MPHIHEKIDFTAQAFVVFNDKVLLHKHSKYDIWVGVGGHIELDEDPNQAVIREVKEEVGLDIELVPPPQFKTVVSENYRELIPPYFMSIHKIDDNHQHIGMEYIAMSKTDQVTPEHPGYVWRWLTKDEIEKEVVPLADRVKDFALKVLEISAGKS